MAPKKKVKHRGVYEKVSGSEVWWINYHDAAGKRRREKVGTKANALRLLDKRRGERLAAVKLPELNRRKVLFGDLLDLALRYAKDHGTPSLVRNFEVKAGLARESLGQIPVEKITMDTLFDWISARGVEPATFNKYRSFFSTAYREGMLRGLTDKNVAKLMRAKKTPGGRYRFLTKAEYAKMIAILHERNPARLPRFIVAVNTGMRLTEQFTLEWPQIDWKRGEIHLLKTKNGDQRDIPMNSVVRDTLRELQRTAKKPEDGKPDHIFPHTGHTVNQRKWFDGALKQAKLRGVKWHTLRHTFCSWAVMADVKLPTVQKWMGHQHITMTMRYSHLAPGHNNEEIEKIAL